MQTIPTTLTVRNETTIRGKALAALIGKYLSFSKVHYGFHSIGASEKLAFPAIFIEPKALKEEMITTAKFKFFITYGIYWYVRDSLPEDVVTLSTFIGEALFKLFSNNALGDLQSANPPTNNFKNYSGFWLDSDFSDIRWSTNYLDPDGSKGVRYERAGRMMFQIMDVVLK